MRDTSVAGDNPTIAGSGVKADGPGGVVVWLNTGTQHLDVLHIGGSVSGTLELSHTAGRAGNGNNTAGVIVDSEGGGGSSSVD